MKNEIRLLHACQYDKCYTGNRADDCPGVHICDMCKLMCNGEVVKNVEYNGIVYEVCHVSEDEIILYSRDYGWFLSIGSDMDRFSMIFNVVNANNADGKY